MTEIPRDYISIFSAFVQCDTVDINHLANMTEPWKSMAHWILNAPQSQKKSVLKEDAQADFLKWLRFVGEDSKFQAGYI